MIIFRQTKNDEAIEKLLKAHARRMYNICLRMTGNKQDAEDVLQEAFYQAFLHFSKLQSIDKFGGWLHRIVINQAISFLRKQIHFKAIESEIINESHENEENWWQNISMDRINKAIQTLPDGARLILNLYLLEDYPHKEIAQMLSISESTSRSQYFRAKQLLQENLLKNIENEQI